MSTLAFTGHTARADGVRPHIAKARKRESRMRRVPAALSWPAWTDDARWGVPDPRHWPAWTSEVRIATTRKGR